MNSPNRQDENVIEIPDNAPENTEIAPSTKNPDTIDPATQSFTHVRVPLEKTQFILVYVGLLLAIMLGALDQTIVATALKSIVAEFGHQDLIPWIGSAYLLTAAPFGTVYGKFADIFGRKPVFLFSIVTFEVGSLICGASNSMEMLIAGRTIAGIGGGGMTSMVLIIISDIVSIQDRGKYQGFSGATFGLSAILGPLLGGAFSDHISWRWCFFINLPLGVITIVAVVAFLKFPPTEGSMIDKIKRVDIYGALLLFASIICLITPLQLGGTIWEWNAAQVIAMFVVAAVLFVIFAFVELKIANEPIIPPEMFVNKSVPALIGISFCLGAGFLSVAYYISFFFQVVLGYSATIAGLEIFPVIFGLVTMSVTAGIVTSKTGNYKMFFFIGPILMSIGFALVSLFTSNTILVKQIFFLFILGLGIGCTLQQRVIATQASVPRERIAVATATVQTANTLGGAIGVAVTGTIVNNLVVSNTASDTALMSFVSLFIKQGLPASTSNALPLLQMLQSASADYPHNDAVAAGVYNETLAAATTELIAGFNGAFKTAMLAALPYPIRAIN
ncbi:hypothetical protein HK100_010242 [Physocladia obscura]|uniref:Major facilitator superfamily (MFS) profile domain-containing protein n=1 Tax=Physocladia obscura TaxID=109957 RepID=A0AAD5T2P1_9FUNG|nr:hypothetical protein HK100_010242 [Physocladia obscura]